MIKPLFDITPILPSIDSSSLILSPNQRLAAKMLSAYDQHQHSLQQTTWLTPQIKALNSWLSDCWETLQRTAFNEVKGLTVLNALQEKLIWENIIQQSEYGELLLRPDQTAATAQQAHQLLSLWNKKEFELGFDETLDKKVFKDWQQQFVSTCEENLWITHTDSIAIVKSAFEQGKLPRLSHITLVGFNDVAPLLQTLIELACDNQSAITPNANNRSNSRQTSCNNPRTEIKAAALWASQLLAADPDATIGIIVPELTQTKTEVEAIFTEVFEPHYITPQQVHYTLPFNFSAGVKLSDTPIVQSAINLLSLNQYKIELEKLCSLLHSPFYGHSEDEIGLRVAFENKLRDFRSATLSTPNFRQTCFKLSPEVPEETDGKIHLSKRLQAFEELRIQYKHPRPPSEWGKIFSLQLDVLNWPGDRRLNSHEYQQVSIWYGVLEQLATYDNVLGDINNEAAQQLLTKMLVATPFQAQTKDSPIQILGTLEAAGLCFSHLWVTGCGEKQLPGAPSPNPFIPIELQKECQMPHADHQRELEYAVSLMDGFKTAAQSLVFSFPSADDDNEVHPSPLLNGIEMSTLDILLGERASEASEPHPFLAITAKKSDLECIEFNKSFLIETDEMSHIRGGSSIFKDQAICPFNSFAVHRLKARPQPEPEFGLSAIERGNIIHNVLEIFWKTVASHQQLCQMSDIELSAQLFEAIDSILETYTRKGMEQIGARYKLLERQRLHDLLNRWLTIEKQRSPFTVVATEKSLTIEFEGIPLNLRIDRIDQLDSGGKLLMDYKTGDPSVKKWAGDRPEEPQLPLYVLSDVQPDNKGMADGICFARINTKGTEFKGFATWDESEVPGIKPIESNRVELPSTWEETQQHWSRTLTRLANDFKRGECAVDYKSNQLMPYYEHLAPLNRINEFATIQKWLNETGEVQP